MRLFQTAPTFAHQAVGMVECNVYSKVKSYYLSATEMPFLFYFRFTSQERLTVHVRAHNFICNRSCSKRVHFTCLDHN